MAEPSLSVPQAFEKAANAVGHVVLSIVVLLMALGCTPRAGHHGQGAVGSIPKSCTAVTKPAPPRWPQSTGGTSFLYNCYPDDKDETASNLMGTLQYIPSTKLNSETPGSFGQFTAAPVQVFVFQNWEEVEISGIETGKCPGGNTLRIACAMYPSSPDSPKLWYVFVVADPQFNVKPTWYDIEENVMHEMGHMADAVNKGTPEANTYPSHSSSFKLLVQHDLYFLDYITKSDGTRILRAPCNTDTPLNLAGPFQALTDPSTDQPFCKLSGSTLHPWVLANSNYQKWTNSKILQQDFKSSGEWAQFAYLFNAKTQDQWSELFGDEFYWASLIAVGLPPPYPEPWSQPVRLFSDDNDPSFFTCSEAWLKNIWNGVDVPPAGLPPMCSSDTGAYKPFQDLPVGG
jgi:hypothetical protein